MIFGMIPYIRSIVIVKETKLNRSSWVIWAIIGIMNLLAYFKAGERETIWFVFAGALNPVILFILSLKYGVQIWYRSDTVCIVIAIFAIILWKTTGNPVLAIIAGLTADGIAICPILIKIKKNPYTENLFSWIIGLTASISNIFAVKEWTWANSIYTIYMVLAFAIIVIPLAKWQLFRKPSPE